ncbi:MAG: hypothetical protein NVV82_01125 [Sporocytophaga sp.]|nr:hypothetical protein [Sporocytophaga sp.]
MNLLKDEEKTIESILTNINYHNQTLYFLAQSHSLRTSGRIRIAGSKPSSYSFGIFRKRYKY